MNQESDSNKVILTEEAGVLEVTGKSIGEIFTIPKKFTYIMDTEGRHWACFGHRRAVEFLIDEQLRLEEQRAARA